jgi:hypothetical protein
MALSQAAGLLERVIGHTGDATTDQNLTSPGTTQASEMTALVWNGKNIISMIETFNPAKIKSVPRLTITNMNSVGRGH